MPKLTDLHDSLTNRVLVYGGPKSGKTKLMGGLAEKFNLLVIDMENGRKTLRSLPREWQERITIIALPDTRVFPIAIETCLKIITGVEGTVCAAHGKWNCMVCKKDNLPVDTVHLNALDSSWIVCFDSLTQLANSTMAHLLKNQDDMYKPEWGDYRNQGALLDKFLSQVQQAKFNVCCLTHEVETELEDGRKKLVPVCGSAAFSRNTAKYFDDVVYCSVANKKHNFASGSTYSNLVLTGSRGDIALEATGTSSLLPFFDQSYLEKVREKTVAAPAGNLNNLLARMRKEAS